MMKVLFSFCLLVVGLIHAYCQTQPVFDTVNAYGPLYHRPLFPGGKDSLQSFIRHNMHYPHAAREANIEGRVIITFMVTEQGEITDIRLKRGLGGGCDEEAKRIATAMPRWIPATYKGRPTRAIERLLITFKLE